MLIEHIYELDLKLDPSVKVYEISSMCFNQIADVSDIIIKGQLLGAIQSKKIKVKLSDENEKFETIEKVDPYQIILMEDELYKFITESYNQKFLNIIIGDTYLYHITKQTKIKSEIQHKYQPIVSESEFDLMLKVDIELLKEHKILTSRLAMVVYRIANLTPYADKTECGRYFRKKVGSKSKVFPRTKYKIPGIKYAFRAYDLNVVNDIKLETQKEIAEKLINLKIKKLDNMKISEVTNLPIDDIDKLYLS